MLKSLAIRNFAVIHQLSIEFHPGLNVITGETGAGKSILVGALGLLTGGRGSTDLLRAGEERLSVEALFEISQDTPAARWLAQHHAEQSQGGEVLLRRELGRDGRSRAWIGSSPATLASLKQVAERLIEIQGQHGQQELLTPAGQRDWLDATADLLGQRRSVERLYAELHDLEQSVLADAAAERERLQRLDLVRFQIQEVERVNPQRHEDEELEAERERLRHVESLRAAASEALQLLYEDDQSVTTLLGRSVARLQEMAGMDARLAPPQAALEEASSAIDEVARALAAYAETLEADPLRLEEIEERRRAIESLKRKYGGSIEEVRAFALDRRRELETLGRLSHDREEARSRLAQVAQRYWEAAEALSRARRRAASELASRMDGELAALAMREARFRIAFRNPAPPWAAGQRPAAGPAGADLVEFRLAANVGEEERALARVASGGELSRVLLGLHVSLEPQLGDRTLVYDEVDAGVGADVAIALGGRLRRVARTHQVLCVTHMHPIAASADHHLRIEKRVEGRRTEVCVHELGAQERVDEVLRMMGGRRAGEVGRRAAAEWVRRREVSPA
ncbi:MAG: DNA repair protein RecN [Acidobacteriota bacterium]